MRSQFSSSSSSSLVLSIVLLSSLFIIFDGISASRTPTEINLSDEWKPIKDVKDPHVVEIGQFAVTEYNKKSKAGLKFDQVVSGESQVVAGMNYKLVLEAKQGSDENKYEAIVWEKPWLHFRNLTSFRKV